MNVWQWINLIHKTTRFASYGIGYDNLIFCDSCRRILLTMLVSPSMSVKNTSLINFLIWLKVWHQFKNIISPLNILNYFYFPHVKKLLSRISWETLDTFEPKSSKTQLMPAYDLWSISIYKLELISNLLYTHISRMRTFLCPLTLLKQSILSVIR